MVSGSRRIPLVNHLPGCSGAGRLAFGTILNQFMEVDAGCGKFPRTLVGGLVLRVSIHQMQQSPHLAGLVVEPVAFELNKKTAVSIG